MKEFILKIDDFRLSESLGKFERLIALCEDLSVPMSIGAIGAGLRGGRYRAQRAIDELCSKGRIELWNHSFNHLDMTKLSDTDVAWELVATNEAIERHLGQVPQGFGAPFNKCDERVGRVAKEQGFDFTFETAFTDAQRLTPEYNVQFDGQPNLVEFIKRVERKARENLLLVQVHPGRWLTRGFEQMRLCLEWLREHGYRGTTAREVLGLSAIPKKLESGSQAHQKTVERLSEFWQARSAEYDAELSNFSSYFLARFRANSLNIHTQLQQFDADLSARSFVDVGCGLAQWGLPFLDFEKRGKLWAFDTNKTVVRALDAAAENKLFVGNVSPIAEDFTQSGKLGPQSVDRIVCANALNYIPLKPFAEEAQRISSPGAQLILVNQTGTFNHLGIVDAIDAANLALAKERCTAALQQDLVRRGFSGFRPARTTYSAEELEAVLFAFGFQLSHDFNPHWEREFRGKPSFQGLVFARQAWLSMSDLKPDFRAEYRLRLCRAGMSSLDDTLFAKDDLAPDLFPFKRRSGSPQQAAQENGLDAEVGRLATSGDYLKVSNLVEASASDDPDVLLAGAVAALVEADVPRGQELARRLEGSSLDPDIQAALQALCRLKAGDAAGARAAVARDQA